MTGPGTRLRQVMDLTAAVSTPAELKSCLTAIATTIASLRDDLHCYIRLVADDARGYRLAAVAPEHPALAPIIDVGTGLTSSVVDRQEPMLIPQVTRTIPVAVGECRLTPGKDGYYGVPVETATRVVGVLGVVFASRTTLREGERELIDFMAEEVAVAVRNAKIHDELRQGRDRRTRSRIALAERAHLAALTARTTSLAEDLNNALTVIRGRTELLLLRAETAELVRGLEFVRHAALNGADIVTRLVTLARAPRDTLSRPAKMRARDPGALIPTRNGTATARHGRSRSSRVVRLPVSRPVRPGAPPEDSRPEEEFPATSSPDQSPAV